jgi:hypothetical protein
LDGTEILSYESDLNFSDDLAKMIGNMFPAHGHLIKDRRYDLENELFMSAPTAEDVQEVRSKTFEVLSDLFSTPIEEFLG